MLGRNRRLWYNNYTPFPGRCPKECILEHARSFFDPALPGSERRPAAAEFSGEFKGSLGSDGVVQELSLQLERR